MTIILFHCFLQCALHNATPEPEDVSVEEKMSVVISMVRRVNAYKHVIMLEITSPVEVQIP